MVKQRQKLKKKAKNPRKREGVSYFAVTHLKMKTDLMVFHSTNIRITFKGIIINYFCKYGSCH